MQALCRAWNGRRKTPLQHIRWCDASWHAGGHEVTILGHAAQAAATRALGAEFVLLAIPDWTPGKSLEEEMDLMGSLLFGPAVGEAVLDHIEWHAPDVVVVDCMLTSGLAAANARPFLRRL